MDSYDYNNGGTDFLSGGTTGGNDFSNSGGIDLSNFNNGGIDLSNTTVGIDLSGLGTGGGDNNNNNNLNTAPTGYDTSLLASQNQPPQSPPPQMDSAPAYSYGFSPSAYDAGFVDDKKQQQQYSPPPNQMHNPRPQYPSSHSSMSSHPPSHMQPMQPMHTGMMQVQHTGQGMMQPQYTGVSMHGQQGVPIQPMQPMYTGTPSSPNHPLPGQPGSPGAPGMPGMPGMPGQPGMPSPGMASQPGMMQHQSMNVTMPGQTSPGQLHNPGQVHNQYTGVTVQPQFTGNVALQPVHTGGPAPALATEAHLGNQFQSQLYARCARGDHDIEKKYGPIGLISAIVLFPIGLLCLFVDMEQKCTRCGKKFAV